MEQVKDTASYLLKEYFKRVLVEEKNTELGINAHPLSKELGEYIIYLISLGLLEHSKAQLTYPHKERMKLLESMLTDSLIGKEEYYKNFKEMF